MDNQDNDDQTRRGPAFEMEIDLNANDFTSEWKRCNLVANYLADYTAYEYKHRELAENLFSTIINELLEAIARMAAFKSVIRFALRPNPGSLSIQVDHECQEPIVAHYTEFVKQVSQGSGKGVYFDLLVIDSLPRPAFNQLGLAMIVHDFGGKIEIQQRGGTPFMRTCVSIPTKEFAS